MSQRKRPWSTVAEVMEAITTGGDQIDQAMWTSPGFTQFRETLPVSERPAVKSLKTTRRRRRPLVPKKKTPPEKAIVAGFSQIFTEYPPLSESGADTFAAYVNLDTLFCFTPATPDHPARLLTILVEHREHHPLDKPDCVYICATQKIVAARRDFFREVVAFHEMLQDAHSTQTAIYPYSDGTFSIQFKRGRFDPLFTRDEVSDMWERRVKRLLLGRQSPPVTYQADHSTLTLQQLCQALPERPDYWGWYETKHLNLSDDDPEQDEEYT